MDNQEINNGRRRFLTLATCGAGGVAALGVATPFVASFFPSEKAKIAFLYDTIHNLDIEESIKDFFYVCISHILKNCSRWLQSGTKPQVDPNKVIPNPFDEFKRHCQKIKKYN